MRPAALILLAIPGPVLADAPVGADVPSLGELGLGMLAVIGLIFALAWVMKRVQSLTPGARTGLKVVSVLPVGTRERIVVVSAGEEQIMVAVAPSGMRTLHVLKEPLPTDEATAPTASFADRLKAAMGERAS